MPVSDPGLDVTLLWEIQRAVTRQAELGLLELRPDTLQMLLEHDVAGVFNARHDRRAHLLHAAAIYFGLLLREPAPPPDPAREADEAAAFVERVRRFAPPARDFVSESLPPGDRE